MSTSFASCSSRVDASFRCIREGLDPCKPPLHVPTFVRFQLTSMRHNQGRYGGLRFSRSSSSFIRPSTLVRRIFFVHNSWIEKNVYSPFRFLRIILSLQEDIVLPESVW